MDKAWRCFQTVLSAAGGVIGWFLGDADGALLALVAFVVMDYITGVIAAGVKKELSSEVGFKGIARKVAIFIIVADLSVTLDAYIRKKTIFFFFLSIKKERNQL